ncbi:MAG: hypothetical protein Q8O67_03055 [Deltaproteobacteria bacterium]|nr:hypothetical protein [Deltaproteobacteria bacterium]
MHALFPLLLALAPQAPGTAAAPPKILILDVRAAAAGDAAEAPLVTQALARSFAELHPGPVVAVVDVRSLLDAKAQNELLGCEDTRCAKDLGDALAADLIVASVYGTLGGQKHLAITLLDAKEARVVDRSSLSFAADGLAVATKTLALRALTPGVHEGGDQALAQLRTAIVINEVDEKQAPQANNTVSNCVQAALLESGVSVLSATHVQRIKSRLDATLKGPDAAAALTADDADVIIFGTARSSLVGKMGSRMAVRTALTFEIVKVDTGEVIAAASASPMQNAVTLETATELASALACKQVKPALATALNHRIERGNRVVVDVPMATALAAGQSAIAVANAVIETLSALKPLVAKATLKNASEKSVVIDVVLRGGDGVRLGLLLGEKGLAARVPEAHPGSLTLLPALPAL